MQKFNTILPFVVRTPMLVQFDTISVICHNLMQFFGKIIEWFVNDGFYSMFTVI